MSLFSNTNNVLDLRNECVLVAPIYILYIYIRKNIIYDLNIDHKQILNAVSSTCCGTPPNGTTNSFEVLPMEACQKDFHQKKGPSNRDELLLAKAASSICEGSSILWGFMN